MSSCEKPSLESEGPGAAASAKADQQAAGNGKNPFSVATMRQAYANLVASDPAYPPDCLVCGPPTDPTDPTYPVQATHEYVRFKPANTDQIADLDDLGFRLSWEPYDESVAAVTTVNYDSDEIPWLYTVVPVGTGLPSYIQQERLDELFLFTTEDGDLADGDPWVPTPEPPTDPCPPQWDPYCRCYIPCAVARTSGGTTTGKAPKPSKQREAAEKLKKTKVSPKALYNEAMRISGNGEEIIQLTQTTSTQPTTQSLFGTRYYPSGFIKVEDTALGTAVPLRGVRVESRRWFNFDQDETDNNGFFSINSGYLNKVKISLEFKSGLATTRGIITGVRVWQLVLPISSDIVEAEKEAMTTIRYTVPYRADLNGSDRKAASTWVAATLFNNLAEARTHAATRGLPPPATGINVWLYPVIPFNGGNYAATPMLRRLLSTSVASSYVDAMLSYSGPFGIPTVLLKQLIQRQLPDIAVFYRTDDGSTMRSPRLNSVLFHELGHTQHYNQVGNEFWSVYIAKIISGGFGYGEKFDIDAGRIAVSEGWGNYVERLFLINKYQTGASYLATAALTELENQRPSDVGYGWFVYGMYHDMTDNTVEPTYLTGVRDRVTAFTPATVFRGLQPNVYTVRRYQQQINLNNNFLQSAELGELVTDYRW